MKALHHSILFLLLMALLSSCKPEKNKGNFNVQLQGFVGNQSLSFTNTTYDDGMQKEFFFSKLKFFISHVKLVKPDNTEVEIEDAAFFDFADNNWKSFTANVDAGTYTGLKFSVGLDPTQNATDPDNYPATDALGPKSDMFWDWLKHRFIVLEGTADTLGNNFSGGNIGLVYHIGRDTCYRNVSLSGINFTVPESADKQINLNLDLLKIFYNPTDTLNMFTTPGTQSENADLPAAIRFADQFSKAFSYSE